MADNNNIRDIYDALSRKSSGNIMPYEEFESMLISDESKRRDVYNALSKGGNMIPFDKFNEGIMGSVQQPPQQSVQPQASEAAAPVSESVQPVQQTPQVQQPVQPQQNDTAVQTLASGGYMPRSMVPSSKEEWDEMNRQAQEVRNERQAALEAAQQKAEGIDKDAIKEKRDTAREKKNRNFFRTLGAAYASQIGGVTDLEGDIEKENWNQLKEASEQYYDNKVISDYLGDALDVINQVEKVDKKGHFNLGQGFIDDAKDLSTWDMGYSDVLNGLTIKELVEKAEAGEPLSALEQDVLDAVGFAQYVQDELGSQVGTSYKVGQSLPQSAGFMASLMLNPASGIGRQAGVAAMRKYGKKALARAARYGGDALEMGIATLTSGGGRTAAEMLEKLNGTATYDTDIEGGYNGYSGQQNQEENLWKAAWQSFASQYVENWSEAVGEYFFTFDDILRTLTNGKFKVKSLDTLEDWLQASKKEKWGSRLADFRRRTKFDGIVGEILEEEVGNMVGPFLENIGNDEYWKQVGKDLQSTMDVAGVFGDPEQARENQLVTIMSCALMCGFLNAVQSPSMKKAVDLDRQVNRAAREGRKVMGEERWTELQNRIDSSTPDEMTHIIKDMMQAARTSEQAEAEIKPTLMYVLAELARQEYHSTVQQAKDEMSETVRNLINAYNTGFTASQTATPMHFRGIRRDLLISRQDVEYYDAAHPGANLKEITDRLVEADNATREQILQGMPSDMRELAEDYLGSYERFRGLYDGFTDAADADEMDFYDSIRPAIVDGTVTTATTADGRDVFVTSNDGKIAYIIDNATGERKEAYPADQLFTIQTVSASELIYEYDKTVEDNWRRTLTNYTEHNEQTQQPQLGMVIGDGDETVIITDIGDGWATIQEATTDNDGNTIPKPDGKSRDVSFDYLLSLQDDIYDNRDRLEGKEIPSTLPLRREADDTADSDMRDRIQQWSAATGVPVKVIDRVEDIDNSQVLEALAKGVKVAGWYNTNTKEVCFYMPNVKDMSEVDKTFIHEVVGHKGMRLLMGEQEYNALCGRVWNELMTDKAKAWCVSRLSNAERTQEETEIAAADEYIAYLAEQMELDPNEETRSLWERFVEMIREFLIRHNLGGDITNEDLSNMLMASLANYRKNARGEQAQTQEAPATEEQTQQPSALASIPSITNEKTGETDYLWSQASDIQTALDAMKEAGYDDDVIRDYANDMIASLEAEAKKLSKPKAGTTMAQRQQMKADLAENERQRLFWQAISDAMAPIEKAEEEATRQQQMEAQAEQEAIDAYGSDFSDVDDVLNQVIDEMDFESMVRYYAAHAKYIWADSDHGTKGFASHMFAARGNKRSERLANIGWLANRDKGGYYPEEVAERIFADLPESIKQGHDEMEALDIIIDTIQSANHPATVVRDMYAELIQKQQEAELREQQRQQEEEERQQDAYARDHGFANYQEMLTFEELWASGEDIVEIPAEQLENYYNTLYGTDTDAGAGTEGQGVVQQPAGQNEDNSGSDTLVQAEGPDSGSIGNGTAGAETGTDTVLPGSEGQETGVTAEDEISEEEKAKAREWLKGTQKEWRDKPLSTLAEVKWFLNWINYKGSTSKVLTDDEGNKFVKYQANGSVTPNIYLGKTTPREIFKQFLLYGNIMEVNIPNDIQAEFEIERLESKRASDDAWAEDREQVKKLLKEAGIPFYDVIDSERGSRIVFTDRKNDNGNYLDYMDVSDADQAESDIESIRAKADKFKAEGPTLFRQANDRASLMGAHNISEEKLRKILKQGGMANPSMAIVDTDKHIHRGYGDISLIPYSSTLDASKRRGVVTYNGDAYSPSYPGVTHQLTNKGVDKIDKMAERLGKGDKNLENYLHARIYEYASENGTRLSTVYLLDKGLDADIIYEQGPRTHEEYERVKDIIERDNNGTTTDEDMKTVLNILTEEENARFAERLNRVGGKEEKLSDWLRRSHEDNLARLTDANGQIYYGKFNSYLDDVRRSEQLRNNRRIDIYRTEDSSLDRIAKAGLTEDYWKWVDKLFTDEERPEMLFAGFTPAGYRRWVPNTLENASRLMNKQPSNNADEWSGWNATKSLLLKRMRTLSDIRKMREQLVSREEYDKEMEELSSAWTSIVGDLSDMQKISDNQFSNMDYAENRLQEAILEPDPIAYLNKEYGYDIDKDGEFAKDLQEAIDNAKAASAVYFEAKFSRPVYLNEFKHAIVPRNADEELINALKDADIQVTEYMPGDMDDYENKVRQATEGDTDVRFRVANENQVIFVSNAAKAVGSIKQEKATPDQWLAMIQKQGGIKAGEDKWLGLSQWIKTMKEMGAKTLTKQEIEEFIDANKIQIEEQRYSEAPSDYDRAVEEEYPGWNEAFYPDVYDGMAGEQLEWNIRDLAKAVELFNNNNSIALHIDIDEDGEIPDSAYDEILDWAKQAFDEIPLEERGINTTRLSYTTNGLENNREIALWVPGIEPWEEGDNIHFGDAGSGRAIAWIRFGDKRVKREERDHKVVESFEEPTKNYKGWDVYYPTGEKFTGHDYIVYAQLKTGEMGYVPIVQNQQVGAYKSLEEARVAMNERFKELNIGSPLYDNVLVIDEIQSKRHQEGRERGYKGQFSQTELDQAREEAHNYSNELYKKYGKPGEDFLAKATKEEKARFEELNSRVSALTRLRSSGIPDAPFDKNWQELAMKRMLRLAAEEGYDKIAWTTGEQQSERYNIGGYLSSIKRRESNDINEMEFALNLNGDNSQYITTDKNGNVVYSLVSEFRDRNLTDIIGKELAEKALALEENEELDTDDITISNGGMATFYDKMLVNFMNKYGKQWGVKVEDVDIPGISEGNWENAGDGLTMHSIDVTPEMKASVLEGQTMFRIGDNEQTHELNAKQKQPGEEVKVAAEAITADIMPFESNPVTKEEIAAARDTNLVKQWKRSKNGDLTRMFGSIPGFVRDFAEATLGIDNKYGLDDRVFYHAAEEMNYIMDYAREHGLDAAIADKHNFKDGETIGRLIEEAKPLYTEKELTEIKKVLPEGTIEALNGALQAFADEKRIKEEMERIRALNDGKTMENALTLYAVVYNRLKENYEGDNRYFHTLGRNITVNPGRVINKDISKEIIRRIATAPVKANLALEDMSDAVDDIRFRLSNNNRKVVTSWLNKRTDLTEAEKAAVLDDIDNLEDAKTQLATGWWFAKGAIRLPEDMPKVEQAVAVSTVAKVDPLNYSSPMELINAHAGIKVKEKPINPDEVSTLHKVKQIPGTDIVVYNVDDSEESRQNMRRIIDTHFGKESSPWCLLQGDGEGNLTEQSREYWDYYNSYPKQVAFKNGKLLAFSANKGKRLWWDRMDESHAGIPVEGKIPNDKLGRSAVIEYDPADGEATVVGDMWRGNPDNGPFETYYDTGQLRRRSTRKDTFDVGPVEVWHRNGQKSAEFTNNELGNTEGEFKTWHPNGQLHTTGTMVNGRPVGVHETYFDNGQLETKSVYPDKWRGNQHPIEPRERYYPNGQIRSIEPYDKDGIKNGTETEWFEDGQKEYEVEYANNEPKRTTHWFQNGDLESTSHWDEDGYKTGVWEKYKWDWDKKKSVPQERITYRNGAKNGIYEEYYPNGQMKMQTNFKDDNAEGLTEAWNEDGTMLLRYVKKDGKMIGHEYYDYDNNEVVQMYTIRDGAGEAHNYVRRLPMEGYTPLTAEQMSTYPDWVKEQAKEDPVVFRVVDDPLLIEALEAGKKQKGYRTVVLNEDGSFGSPMASKLGNKGKKSVGTSSFNQGQWEEAEENPSLATDDGKIKIKKPNGKSLDVDYNPYVHIRPTAVNTQFKQAWERPDLVYIETEYPERELTSGYKAEKASLPVGRHKWSGGTELILSRWDKPKDIVSWDKVADAWAAELKGKEGIEFDVVPPQIRDMLTERGIKILPPHKNMGKRCNEAYKKWLGERGPEGGKKSEETPKNTSLDEVLYRINVNHNSPYLLKKADGRFVDPFTGERLGFDTRFMSSGEGAQVHGWGVYFSKNDIRRYADPDVLGGYDYKGKDISYWAAEEGSEAIAAYDILNRVMFGNVTLEQALDESVEYWSKIENDDVVNVMRGMKVEDFTMRNQRHHYDVSLPEDTGDNYLDEQITITKPQRRRIADAVRKLNGEPSESVKYVKYQDGWKSLAKMIEREPWAYSEIRDRLVQAFGGKLSDEKRLSDLMSSIGFAGVHYNGAVDGECYVIFNENDAHIVGHTMFRVTPEQDAEYRKAYEEGDTEKASQMVKDAFKAMYPDTKVVDENGKPLRVYHFSDKAFTEFDKERIGSANDPGFYGNGFYFSKDRDYAGSYGENEYGVFLNIEHPFIADNEEKSQASLLFNREGDEMFESMVPDNLKEKYTDEIRQADGVIHDGPSYFRGGQAINEYVVPEANQIKSAEPFTFDDNGNLIPLSERFNPENNDIRFREAEQGSLFTPEEMNGGVGNSQRNITFAGNSNNNERTQSDVQRQGDNNGAQDAGRREAATSRKAGEIIKPLRKLKEGETCLVERKMTEDKNFSFIGPDRIETSADVAYIFKELENKAIENAFLVFQGEEGTPAYVLHVGMGNVAASSVDLSPIIPMVDSIKPKKIWLVHNHPSGQLKPSRQDNGLLQAVRSIIGVYAPEVAVPPGIIIDTTRGVYGEFDGYGVDDILYELEASDVERKAKYPVYKFDEQAFSKDYVPDNLNTIRHSGDVAKFVATHRLGERSKINILVLNTGSQVVGNFFSDVASLDNSDDALRLARECGRYMTATDGAAVIVFGTGIPDIRTDEKRGRAVKILNQALLQLDTRLLDVQSIDKNDPNMDYPTYYSYVEHGAMEEMPEYGDIRMRVSDGVEDRRENESPKEFIRRMRDEYRKRFNEVAPMVILGEEKLIKPELKVRLGLSYNANINNVYKVYESLFEGDEFGALGWSLNTLGVNKTIIFAREDKPKARTALTTMLHENVHAAISDSTPDERSKAAAAILQWSDGYYGKDPKDNWIRRYYSKWQSDPWTDEDNELIAYVLGFDLENGIDRQRAAEYVGGFESLRGYFDNILNKIHKEDGNREGTGRSNAGQGRVGEEGSGTAAGEVTEKETSLKQAEEATDTNPTEGQKEAGNYKHGHTRQFGMDLSIEIPEGSTRSGVDADGKEWSRVMNNTYGYIRGTMGRDKDHIDFFLGPNLNSDKVFVVDQRNVKTGAFDEHKVMLGFDDIEEARDAYNSNYDEGWQGLGDITETSLDNFKEWAFRDGRRVQPFGGNVRFRVRDEQEYERIENTLGVAAARYERAMDNMSKRLTEVMQDSMKSVDELQKAVAEESGKPIRDYENAYWAAIQYSSRNKAMQEAYHKMFYRPLMDEVAKLVRGQGDLEAAMDELNAYLLAKHGLERNEVFARRDAKKEYEEYINQHPKGTRTEDDFYLQNRRRDYSGLTALMEEKNVTAAEGLAQALVDNYEKNHDTAELWKRINAATKETLRTSVQGGVLSQDKYQELLTMFQNYVPLRGFDETTSDDIYGYYGTVNSPYNTAIKAAKGRRSLADSPLATIANIADSEIMRANRNRIYNAALNLAENHHTRLMSVSEVLYERDPQTGQWHISLPQFDKNDTPEDVAQKMAAHRTWFAQQVLADPMNYRTQKEMANVPYKVISKSALSEHQVMAMRDGKQYIITINANPRAAQALAGKTNPDSSPALQWLAPFNRFLASVFTQYNPSFVLANLTRDGIYTNAMVWAKESPKYAKDYNKNWGRSLANMASLLSKYKKDTLDDNVPIERYFKEFIDNGGETGYTQLRSVKDYKKIMNRELKDVTSLSPAAAGRKVMSVIGDAVDNMNRWAEGVSRFAAYMTSREQGRSVTRSVEDAKEISVNFNKKGSGVAAMTDKDAESKLLMNVARASQLGRELFVFFNAGVQGMANAGGVVKNNPKKATALMAGLFLAGAALAMMNGGDGDDDDEKDYYNLPEYIRRSNICIKVGKHWLTIPLPIELRALYGLGELAYSVMSGNEYYEGKELAYEAASQLSQILPIDFLEGNQGTMAFIPSGAKPVVEAYWLNQDWTGAPIYNESPFNEFDPEWRKAYKSTSPALVAATRALSNMTGGNVGRPGTINLNPARIEHLFEGYLGGVGTILNQAYKTAGMAWDEDLREMRNVPIVSRFIKDADDRAAVRAENSRYHKVSDYVDEVMNEDRRLRQIIAEKEITGYDYDEKAVKDAEKRLDKLRESKEWEFVQEWRALDKGRNRAREGRDEEAFNSITKQMNDLYREYRKKK